MKHVKRIACLLLALVMVFALTVTAFAEGEGRSTKDTPAKIIIVRPHDGDTYTVYRMFDLVSYDPAQNIYSYKINSEWSTFLEYVDPVTGDAVSNYLVRGTEANQDPTKPVVLTDFVFWKSGVDNSRSVAANVAALAKSYIASRATSDNPVDPVIAPVVALEENFDTYNNPVAGSETEVEVEPALYIDVTGLGYYFVSSTVGALCSLDTTDTDAIIWEKNTAPTVTKQVKTSNSPENWGDSNSANVGDKVEFKSSISLSNGTENLILHDTMCAGLTFGAVTEVRLTTAATKDVSSTTTSTVNKDDYKVISAPAQLTDADLAWAGYEGYDLPMITVTTGEGEEATTTKKQCECTFHVLFKKSVLDSIKSSANSTIDVFYNATLNKDAVIANTGNPNESLISYGQRSHFSTKDETVTYTWKFGIFKYTNRGGADTPLADAEFSIYATQACTPGTEMTLYKASKPAIGGHDNVDYYSLVPETEGATPIKTIVTGSTGLFAIKGLNVGSYYVKETKAPDGYNLLNEPRIVNISATGEVSNNSTPVSGGVIRILNNAGNLLPSTGGIGTTIFYVVGSVLLLGAVVLLITKKRMGTAK